MILRGISEKEIEKAIIKGSKRLQNGKIVSLYAYFEVVYKKIEDEMYVITVKPR